MQAGYYNNYFFRKLLNAIATAPQSMIVAAMRTISAPVFIV